MYQNKGRVRLLVDGLSCKLNGNMLSEVRVLFFLNITK